MDEKDKGSSTCVKSPEKGSKGENHLVEEENPDGEGPSDTDSTPTKKDTAQDLQTNQDSNDSCVSKSSAGSHHLSPEEKDRYAFISEQLNILNSNNTGSPSARRDNNAKTKKAGTITGLLSRGISPFKKIAKGIKRTRRKSPTKVVKKLRLQLKGDSEKLERPLKQSDFENSSSDDESSSEDEKWRIFEESSEDEIDRTLEDKADSLNLSALNVKSIIHKIVTDEHVLKMIQNSVESGDADKNDGEDAKEDDGSLTFEPKMTRSKMKDFLQKQGSVPHPWGLSPVKHDSPSFVDIDLPEEEEEEDEDFDPEKVPVVESDEDSESVMSSNVSDLGSPMPSTPRTPCVTPTLSHRYTDTEDSQSLLSPMGPPTQLPRSTHKGLLGRKYQDAVAAEEARAKQEEEELIALRTRSKCPMTDTSILELEANFVAPDITEDMYETKCDDSDWDTFLTSLTKVDSTPDESEDPVKDAEEDDPEYNYLEEAEQYEQYDSEDFRDDRAVKVSKKELHMLMDELYEAYGDMDPIDIECKSAIKAQSRQIVQASTKKPQPQPSSVWKISENERKQIDEHMRKHVQLLTQLYILSQGPQHEHKAVGESAKMLLNELHNFASRQERAFPGRPTALRACNLDQAYAVVNDPEILKERELTETPTNYNKEGSRRPIFKFESLTLPPMTFPQMNLLWTSPVFMYLQLLPHGGLFKINEIKKDRSRVKFLECEDNLLALGLEQFKSFPNGREIIQQLLLPTKTKKQISIRIKNLSARASKDNAVKYYRTTKHLPPFPRRVSDFNVSMMKAPKDQSLSAEVLPNWCKVFLSPSKDPAFHLPNKETTEPCGPSCVVMDFTKPRSGSRSSMSGQSLTESNPSTPLNAGTDNTLTGSSGSSGKSADIKLIKRPPGRRRLYSQKTTPAKNRGSFVPLKTTTFPNATLTEGRISPITVYVVDKMPVISASSSVTPSVSMVTGLATSTVVTCVTPTIVVVNPAMAKPSVSAVSTTFATQSSVMSNSISLSRSTPNLGNPGDTASDRPRSKEIQSTLDLHKESAAKDSIDETAMELGPEGSEVNNEKQESYKEKPLSRSVSDLDTGSGKELQAAGEKESVSPSTAQLNPTGDSQSKISENQPKVTLTSELLLRSDITRAETPTNELQNVTVIQGHCTPVLIQSGPPRLNERSPNSGNKSNNSTPSSKSAIEIMASFAPYFISPSNMTNPEPRCQCTTDRKYRPVFPKLSTTSSESTVSPFLDKEKSKASPRKRQLQQKARSILPKGFVISTFTSPSKKAASTLVDRAKGMKSPRGKPKGLFSPQKGTGFRKILPNPVVPSKAVVNISQKIISDGDKNEKREIEDDIESQKDTASEYDTQESEFMSDDMLESYDIDEDFEATEENEENENVNNNAQDEKSADTESDDTQSEDGNETQDDGDSQEENMDVDDEDHMANLMEASTTLRFKPAKAAGGLSSLKAKRLRHKDVTLALLAPDIIESDPYRDDRDTAFAQAYLLKVKKVLRDDLDKYEKFLRLMYEFNKSGQSPVKLYTDLTDLFSDCPDLLHDFAGFLLPEQAVECDCFLSHQEFFRARTFLRKLEIYFSKTPSQFQKIMRAFTRWYKKPSRDLEDLRSQVEPMLRGQKCLLEEFSLFFPNDKPPESAADDFEEIDFDKSDDESKFDGFEEVELPEERDPQGTKRCQCQCHSTGDDTYRKRKKHCLSCCLTVIDGELVYRINSKTIKKINVKLGPTVKPLPAETREKTDNTNASKPAPVVEPERSQVGEELSDTEAAEKENIENYDDSSQKAEAARSKVANKLQVVSKNKQLKNHQGVKDVHSWKKSSFHQRVSSWSRKSKYSSKGAQLSSGSDTKIPSEQNSNESIKSQESVNEQDGQDVDFKGVSEITSKEHVEETSQVKILSVEILEGSGSSSNLDLKTTESATDINQCSSTEAQSGSDTHKQSNSELAREVSNGNIPGKELSPEKRPVGSSSDSVMASDILARAFNSAILGEVSMDSTSIPFVTSHESPVKISSSSQNFTLQEPKPSSSSSSQSISFGGGPEGQVNFTVSSDSSFSKIKKSGSSGFLVGEDSEQKKEDHEDTSLDVAEAENEASKTESDDSVRNMSASSPRDITETSVASPFSPFSPFAQEVQNITSAKSPFACIKSPNTVNKKQTTPKFRRITPIRVRGSNVSEDESSSAFQALAQNSPLIEDSQLKSPFDKTSLERHSSTESLNKTPVPSSLVKDITFPPNVREVTEKLEQPVSQCRLVPRPGSASNSQKSIGTLSSQKSVESEQSGSQKSGTCAESGSQKSDSGSQKSDSSEQRTSPVVISQPEMYSEDANEGFIKPAISDADIVHTGILSENSLIGLVKGSSLARENLNTISNLTNILSALEKPVSQPQAEQNELNVEKSVPAKEHLQTENESKHSAGTYIPQSTTSIENLERLKHLDIKVSRLSDSDESCSKFASEVDKGPKIETTKSSLQPETENENVSVLTCDSNTTNSYQLDFSTFSDKDKESPDKTPRRFSGDRFTYLDDTTVIQSQFTDVPSLTGDNVTENDKSNNDETDSANTHVLSDLTESVSEQMTGTNRNDKEPEATQKKSSEKAKMTSKVRSPLKSPRRTSSLGRSSARLSINKQKTETKSRELGNESVLETIEAVISESSSSCSRTSAETTRKDSKSSMMRKKSTKDNLAKNKTSGKVDKVKAKKSPVCKSFSKKESKIHKTVVKDSKCVPSAKSESVDTVGSENGRKMCDSSKAELYCEESSQEATVSDLLPVASTADTGQDVRPETSSSSIDDSSIEAGEDDMVWTKDMDEVILEGCKLHGPKDRTFSRIAKQIGGVTDKQVQKRFHRLLTLLLESGSEDEGS